MVSFYTIKTFAHADSKQTDGTRQNGINHIAYKSLIKKLLL